jgi:DNA-binding MarR family transcriptional regulator
MLRRPHRSYISTFLNVLTQLCEALRPTMLPELTISQINVLNELDLVRPIHPSYLATRRGVTRAAISQSMRRLFELGLVDRRRSASDARFIELRLTPEGDRLRRLPSSIDPERAQELLWRLTVELRYATSRTLNLLETTLAAARGRDFWAEEGAQRRDLRRTTRSWSIAADPPKERGPGRPPVALGSYPSLGDDG